MANDIEKAKALAAEIERKAKDARLDECPVSVPVTAPEILPCPFCGGPATVEEVDNGIKGVSFSVGCCADEPDCMGYQSFTTFARRCDAIAAWNKRKQR